MKCAQCKTDNPDNANFCKNCQAPLNNKYKICPNGHHYESRYDSCPHCPQSVSAAETVVNGVPRQPNKKFDETVVDDGIVKLDRGSNPAAPAKTPSNQTPFTDSDRTMIYSGSSKRPSDPTERVQTASVSSQSSSQYAPRRLIGWLVTFDLDPVGIDYKLTVGRQRIGRDPGCEIVIDDPAISSEHAVLLYRDGQVIINDSLSANGTYVNGESIIDKTNLHDNDIIRFGQLEFKIKLV